MDVNACVYTFYVCMFGLCVHIGVFYACMYVDCVHVYAYEEYMCIDLFINMKLYTFTFIYKTRQGLDIYLLHFQKLSTSKI